MNIGGNQEHWQRWGGVLWDTFLNALDDNNSRTEIKITDQMCWSACIMCNDWLTSKYLIARKAAKLPKVWHYWEAEQSHKNQFCLLSEEWLVLLRLIRVIPRQHFQVAARQYSRGSWHKGEWWPLEVATQFCDCSHKLQRRHLPVNSIYKHWHFKTCMCWAHLKLEFMSSKIFTDGHFGQKR